jgi:predicted membrane protein
MESHLLVARACKDSIHMMGFRENSWLLIKIFYNTFAGKAYLQLLQNKWLD